MSAVSEPITIRILDKEYTVACPIGEKDALLAAVRRVDGEMRRVRGSGKVVGTDRIAVMVALNLANELIRIQSSAQVMPLHEHQDDAVRKRLHSLNQRLDNTMMKYGT